MKTQPLRGVIFFQGDKSIAHRAVLLASLACGETLIDNFPQGLDNQATIRCCQSLGAQIETLENNKIKVTSKGLLQEPDNVLSAGESGTTLRLMAGLLASQPFFSVLTGDSPLRKRPMKRITEPLSLMGAKIWGRSEGSFAPLAIKGSRLKGITYTLPVASAQVKSAILLAGLKAEGTTVIEEPVPCRDHTEKMFPVFGVPLRKEGTKIILPCTEKVVSPSFLKLPGDISSSAFFVVAGLLIDGSEILINNICLNPTRTAYLDVLKAMGGSITLSNVTEINGELTGSILVKSSCLHGVTVKEELIPSLIDEIPALALAASFACGKTIIPKVQELRVKESDRLHATCLGLSNLGADIKAVGDSLEITGQELTKEPVFLETFGDHRLAMLFLTAGLVCGKEFKIDNISCISKSCPDFSFASLIRS